MRTLRSVTVLAASTLAGGAAALSVDVTSGAAALAAGLALDGVALVGTPTLTAPEGAAGLFSGGTADQLTVDAGVLLSTGFAADAVGPNEAADTGDGAGGPGSSAFAPFLEAETFDAATFTFDFTLAEPGDVTLAYLFATEEFPEFVNEGVNDTVLVFFDDVQVGNTSAATTGFLDNSGEVDAAGLIVPGSAPLDIEFDGITTPIAARAIDLDAGLHTVTVVLADVGDEFVDSAVFLSSLTAEPIPTPSAAAAGLVLLALGAARRRNRG